jgi:voltage-gated potassium channel
VLLLFLFIVIIVFQTASVLILIFESTSSDANILTSGDALWWSFVTVATVGYGDKVPITTGGRLTALFLMLVGIAMFGILTSTLSDWFRRPRRLREAHRDKENRTLTVAEVQELLDQQSQIFQKNFDELAEKISSIEKK